MGDCNHCSGSCSSCGGCGITLTVSEGELHLLRQLGQIPFLPVARRADDMVPVYREDNAYTQEEYAIILQLLEQKRLISIDYDQPLRGYDMSAYQKYLVHGSFALTARGQQTLELLEIQGTE